MIHLKNTKANKKCGKSRNAFSNGRNIGVSGWPPRKLFQHHFLGQMWALLLCGSTTLSPEFHSPSPQTQEHFSRCPAGAGLDKSPLWKVSRRHWLVCWGLPRQKPDRPQGLPFHSVSLMGMKRGQLDPDCLRVRGSSPCLGAQCHQLTSAQALQKQSIAGPREAASFR